MRMLRLSLMGTVIFTLLVGLGGVAVAQTTDEETLDPMRASSFTGTWEEVGGSIEPDWIEGPGYGDSLDNEVVGIVEASDPRISGDWLQVLYMRTFPVDWEADIWAVVSSAAVRIENDAGAWAGTLDGYWSGDDFAAEWNRLAGEGAYEGLTAVFRWISEDSTLEGVIVPGVPPDYPAPIVAGSVAVGDEAMEEAPAEEASADEAAEATTEDEATATAEEGDEELSGTAVYIDGLRTFQYWAGDDTIYELEMSDPRANGTYREYYAGGVGDVYDGDSERPSIAVLGHVTLVNDEGSWSGLQSAVWDDEMGWRLTAWLAGEDAYDGLSLYLHAHRFPVYSTPEMDFEGIIFEGEPPVMLDAVTVPAE